MNERCVCGYPRARHTGERLLCPDGTGKAFRTMKLPEGKTCADCAHFKRTCSWLLSYSGTETSCDWFPIRFYPILGGPNA